MSLKAILLGSIGVVITLSTALAQTVLTNSYTNTFDSAGNTAPFTGGSVASWVYWFTVYQHPPLSLPGNLALTNDPTMDAQGQTNTSGSLLVVSPFGSTPDQNVFFGNFDNQYGYDKTEVMPLDLVTNMSFDIHVAPGTPTNSSGGFGKITMFLVDPGWNGGDNAYFAALTIPGSATNGWVHLTDTNIASDVAGMIAAGYTNAAGIGFDYNSYSGYPTNQVTFWLDNVAVTTATAPPPPPPPPTLNPPQVALPGLNLLAVDNDGAVQDNRYSIATLNDTGYSFVGQPSVTYSWTITAFPGQSSSGFQQHLFLVPSPSGNLATENDPDWVEPNVVFVTVQYESSTTNYVVANGITTITNTVTNWFGVMSFRYKTNDPNGNGMLFNGTSPTNASNTNLWPVEPIGSVRSPTPLGTWSLAFNNTTNITMTSPSGATTNFTWPAAAAQLFADPMYVVLGAQPNAANGYGQDVVITNFSIIGSQSPFSDDFATDGALNPAIWQVSSADPNAVQVIPPGTNYWISWSTPDSGYDLQVTASLSPTNWFYLTGANAFTPLPDFENAGNRTILFSLPQSSLSISNQAYFRLRNDVLYGP